MKKIIPFLFAPLISILSTTATSQTIEGFSAESTSILLNTNANLQLKINRNMQTNLICGFAIDFGNGETKEYVAGLNGNADENMTVSYQFKQPGTYQVSVDGKFPITDLMLLAKALAIPPMCWGSKKTVVITVADNAPKKPEPAVEDDEVKKLKEKIAQLEALSGKNPEPKKVVPPPAAPLPQSTTPTPAPKPAPAPKPVKANADSIL